MVSIEGKLPGVRRRIRTHVKIEKEAKDVRVNQRRLRRNFQWLRGIGALQETFRGKIWDTNFDDAEGTLAEKRIKLRIRERRGIIHGKPGHEWVVTRKRKLWFDPVTQNKYRAEANARGFQNFEQARAWAERIAARYGIEASDLREVESNERFRIRDRLKDVTLGYNHYDRDRYLKRNGIKIPRKARRTICEVEGDDDESIEHARYLAGLAFLDDERGLSAGKVIDLLSLEHTKRKSKKNKKRK